MGLVWGANSVYAPLTTTSLKADLRGEGNDITTSLARSRRYLLHRLIIGTAYLLRIVTISTITAYTESGLNVEFLCE